MSTRLIGLLGLAVLISMGLLMACGSHYSSSSDGLVIVPSQGSAVLQAFSFNLATGRSSQINTAPAIQPTPPAGSPLPIVMDHTGAFAYVASVAPCTPKLDGNSNFQNVVLSGAIQASITAYKVNSDGTLTANGSGQFLKANPAYPATGTSTPALPMFPACGLDDSTNPGGGNPPAALAIDSSGKFLFVAGQLTAATYSYTDNTNPSAPVNKSGTATLPGVVQVFSISNGSVTEVAGSPFPMPTDSGGIAANPLGLAVSPTNFPVNTATGTTVCSGLTPPTTENLYVTDSANNEVFEFAVDSSSGALSPVQRTTSFGIATGSVPSGIAVDPCNRFVYVANQHDNNLSGYTICNVPSVPNCPNADGSLVSTGAPTSAGNGPTVLAIDPLGNFVYVVDSAQGIGGGTISGFKISPSNGALTALTPVATGANPVSIAIRGDDQWLFVTNNGVGSIAGSVSQYSITPASGALAPVPSITTDNFPWGVAVR